MIGLFSLMTNHGKAKEQNKGFKQNSNSIQHIRHEQTPRLAYTTDALKLTPKK